MLLCIVIASALGGPAAAATASDNAAGPGADGNAVADFDRNLLSGAGQNTTDLSRFERGNPVLPGQYNVDVYVNNAWATRADVRFASPSNDASAVPCVTSNLLGQLGLHPANASSQTLTRMEQPGACVTLGELIPGARMDLDLGDLRLDTSVPQAYLGHMPRGYVDPKYWDAGIRAALLNYTFNGYQTRTQGQSQSNAYLGLNAGLNVGLWHLRDNTTFSWQSATGGMPARHQWQTIDSYVQRDIPSLRAQLTLGDAYTDGQVFDSFGLRGAQLASDDRMLPDSVRGYAPIVRGVAETNALVTIRQGNAQLYQTTVAPGPFTISDLYPTGYGGDLEVTVTEADGRLRRFSVPYASVAQLLRPGTTRFDLAAGQLRNATLEHNSWVAQATAQHGFSNLATGYGGLQGAQGYGAALLGGALNTSLGAFAADVTFARAQIPGQSTMSGHSLRLTYSKILTKTGTSLSVAAYRYSTSGYLSLTDAALARDYARRGLDAFTDYTQANQTQIDGVTLQDTLTPAQRAALAGRAYTPVATQNGLQRQRNRFSLTLYQQLGNHAGALYANGSASDYWNRRGTDTQFQLGYSNSVRGIGYSLSATRSRDAFGRYDNQYNLSINLPLGDTAHAPSFNANFAHSRAGTQEQAMLNGAAGVDNQFNYGVAAAHGDANGAGTSASANAAYRASYAALNASVGSGSGYSQASVGASGAVAIHSGGVTFGQPTGDTVGIVHAPGARGARLANAVGVRIDRFGYALVPYLTPYYLNTVQLDPKGLPLDVQMEATSAQVAPYGGAMVRLDFKTRAGRGAILRVLRPDGAPVPFGAEVTDLHGATLGVVGQAGQALLSGLAQDGVLTARWQDADGRGHHCSLPYRLDAQAGRVAPGNYQSIEATCVPDGEARATGEPR